MNFLPACFLSRKLSYIPCQTLSSTNDFTFYDLNQSLLMHNLILIHLYKILIFIFRSEEKKKREKKKGNKFFSLKI